LEATALAAAFKQIVETAGLRAPAGLSIDRLLMPFNLNRELNPLAVVV
jgi:hypothetical protein